MRHRLLLITCAGALALAACHKTGENANNDVKNPEGAPVVNAAQDVAATGVGVASATTAGGFNTKAFVENAARGDMYEIEAAKIAEQRSKDPKVKAFAKEMITDHTKIDADLKKTITDNHIEVTPPTELDQRRQGMIDNLKQSGDSDFDGAYLHQQLAAHVETVDLLKGFQNHGDNDALKAPAGKAAPIVEHHLAMVRDIGGDKLKDAVGAK